MMKRTIATIEGKEYVEQWFCERSYCSGSGEQQYTYSFPEPMDRVISILEFRSSSSVGWTDGWDYVSGDDGLSGSGVRIIYDSCHEHNRGTNLNRWIYVFGYKLTGEVPKPPEGGEVDPGGDTGATTDKIEDLENRISKLEADIPIGTVRYVYSIPEGWIELNGQLVSRTEYSDLWSWANSNNLVVTEEQWNAGYVNNRSNKGLFSYGDNSTTFRLPDFRSRFIRGLDNGVGYDPDRLLGTEELPTLVPGYDNNDDIDYFRRNGYTPDSYFAAGGTVYTWCNIGYLTTRAYENGVPGIIDYPDRDVAGCWSGDKFDMLNYQGAQYSSIYKENKSTRFDLYYTANIRDRLGLGTEYGMRSTIDETSILPTTWYTASRPRNIALHAIIKYK